MVADPHGARVLTGRPDAPTPGTARSPGSCTRSSSSTSPSPSPRSPSAPTRGRCRSCSDGYHSLTDSASNVVGLVGISIARQPPDAEHPYGHRKYETMASVAILIFLIIVLVEVVSSAVDRVLQRRHAEGVSRRHRADDRHAGDQPVRRRVREACRESA